MNQIRKVIPLIITVFFFSLSFGQKMKEVQLNGLSFKFPKRLEYIDCREKSGQHFFKGKRNGELLSISARNPDKFEFYNKDMTDFQLVEAYYKWEYDYWKDDSESSKVNTKLEELEVNTDEGVIFWKLILLNEDFKDKNGTIFLFGIKKNKLIGLSLRETKKVISDADKISYLKEIYKGIK